MLDAITHESFSAYSQTLRLMRKQNLYYPGDSSQSVFRVQEGLIRITKMTPEGKTLTVRHLKPGDFFGEESLTGQARIDLAETLTSAQIEAIDPAHINDSNLHVITKSLSEQMKRMLDYGYHLHTGNLQERVARYLLQLAETPLAVKTEDNKTMVSVTHELIAEGTASTRESVSVILTELREASFIETGYRSIILTNEEELEMLSVGF